MVHTKLIIENLIKEESQGTYTCAAGLVSQTADPWPVKHNIVLYVVEATLLTAYVPLGEEVHLTCVMPTSEVPDDVVWHKDGKTMTGPSIIKYDAFTKTMMSTYRIEATTRDDYEKYTAIAFFGR